MMRLLDLFCGAGGAAMGLYRAGFDEIVGVDLKPQPRYPFTFVQADATTFPLSGFDAIWASPPCQHDSVGSARWRAEGRTYPNLIPETRKRMFSAPMPFVIENVQGARQKLPGAIVLCGQMFGLGVVRHRLFEANFFMKPPEHPKCAGAVTRDLVSVTGHGPPGRFYRAVTVAGHGGNSRSFKLSVWKEAMGIDWMSRDELTQAIPPAYSEYIGRWLMQACRAAEAREGV
jgi:DNA (cytosine-5)-methyltransferase 1